MPATSTTIRPSGTTIGELRSIGFAGLVDRVAAANNATAAQLRLVRVVRSGGGADSVIRKVSRTVELLADPVVASPDIVAADLDDLAAAFRLWSASVDELVKLQQAEK